MNRATTASCVVEGARGYGHRQSPDKSGSYMWVGALSNADEQRHNPTRQA
jgi:hypothetical protein